MLKHYINIILLVINIFIAYIFFKDTNYFTSYLLFSGLLFFIVVSCGVLFLKFNYFLQSKIKLDTNQCLLTFDDGPDPQFTLKILDILKEENVKSIFFLIGTKVELNPEIVARIKHDGHYIGNHTYHHNNFLSLLPKSTILKEIELGAEAISKITIEEPTFFRPPIGYTNPNYARVLKKLKSINIGWNLRSYDTIYKDPIKFEKRMLRKVKNNDIVLFHDNLEITSLILHSFIKKSKNKGIIFVPLNDNKELFT